MMGYYSRNQENLINTMTYKALILRAFLLFGVFMEGMRGLNVRKDTS